MSLLWNAIQLWLFIIILPSCFVGNYDASAILLTSASLRAEEFGRHKRNFVPSKQTLPVDFLEVPITPRRNITATTPDPNVSLAITYQDERLKPGATIDIGSPIKMIISLDKKSAAIYGIRVQKLVAQGNNERRYSEAFVDEGCAKVSTIFPDMTQIDRSTVENVFRAFRFPDSPDVRFVATVQVCRQRCPKIKCLPQLSDKSRLSRAADAGLSNHPVVANISKTNSTVSNSHRHTSPQYYSYVALTSNVTVRGFDPQFMLGKETLTEKARRRLSSSDAVDGPNFPPTTLIILCFLLLLNINIK
ncbi:uncharacterized protein LOC129597039 [Paramacrobiotus metropolitanus]|uniref:uncharacterized protein LOC129597039 n=1 Tax=Paramacrobiotus metropolitanus TaxID=2943436 RepID=UPI0024464DB3|nr:uncharacterized protein LOC129597039 [Paramacrobiotus metropolitanus]